MDAWTSNIMDVLIPFITSTETPFFFLYVVLFVYTIRAAATREKGCNDRLAELDKEHKEILRLLREIKSERRIKIQNDGYDIK